MAESEYNIAESMLDVHKENDNTQPKTQSMLALKDSINQLVEDKASYEDEPSLLTKPSLIDEDTLSINSDAMTDDIDIEEHDLLENPAIRNIFPDLSLIKQEIKSYEEGLEIIDGHQFLFQNVYVDNATSIKVEDNLDNSYDTSSDDVNQATKIILGSKPGIKLDYVEFEENVNSYEPKLQLIDMKPYLDRSERFCRQCLTLFPNKHDFEMHVIKIHPYTRPNIKFTTEGSRKGKGNKLLNKIVNAPIMCTSCNIKFTAQSSLSRHNTNFHSDRTVKKNSKIVDTPNMKITEQNKIVDVSIMCTKCNNIKFTTHSSWIRHCTKFHSKQTPKKNSTVQETSINVKSGTHACFHCNKEFLTQESLIQHLYNIIQLKILQCMSCSKTFSSKADFDRHILWHKNSDTPLNDQSNGLYKNDSHSNVQVLDQSTDKDLSKRLKNNPREKRKKEEREKEQDSNIFEYGTVEKQKKKETSHNTNDEYYKCHICLYHFKDSKSCLEHLKIKHKITEYGTVEKQKKKEISHSTNDDYYRCHICLYYFKDSKSCLEHLKMKHKITDYISTLKSVKFDSFCDLCQRKYDHLNLYNCHVSLFHSNDINGQKIDASQLSRSNVKDESLLLKSTLFRCTKCDIHFLSVKVATNHNDHMEMLINWKCNKCMRFFKKEDERRHTKQHVFPNLMVYDLCPDSNCLVLFNCLKCTVHFDENRFLQHYTRCENEIPNAVYCKYCDILIDESISKSHEANHVSGNIKNDNLTIVYADVMSINDQIVEQLDDKIDLDDKKETGYKLNQNTNKINSINFNSLCELTYCETCKMFIVKKYTHKMHIEGRCHHLQKHVCKVCGLVFPSQHYKTHKKLHYKMKGCKLQNFKFYDIKGKLISPPLPEYPKCEKCDLVTVSRPEVCHDCNKVNYLTCHICEISLTEEAFKLHMSFHKFLKTSSATGCNNKPNQLSSEWNFDEEDTSKLAEDSMLLNLLYKCENCNLTVETYDKAVEHSQAHYSGEWKNIETEKCELCDIIFAKTCYGEHEKMHLSGNHRINSTILNFDSFYLTSDNGIWVKHVFCGLSQTQINAIINKSIYKFECRVKMNVVQDGPPNLTVYKCDKCCSYIDESSLYKHAENSCFKLRKHHCSICNLPFISSFARTQHEQIHTDPNIGWKSYRNYRIVIFNKETDTKINKMLCYRSQYYVLYRCRNCYASVDETQTRNHNCNEQILMCCSLCGLLIHEEYYETHIQRHRELSNFTKNKLKVILFGDCSENQSDKYQEKESFNGILYDYTLYGCKRCQVITWHQCHQSVFTNGKAAERPSKHTCASVANRSKCPLCDLCFHTSKLKYHTKFHENDLEFTKENIRIIMFDLIESSETKLKDEESMITTEPVHFGDENPSGSIDVTCEDRITKFDLTESSETKLKDEGSCTTTTKSVHFGDEQPPGSIDVTSENNITKFDLTESSKTKLKDEGSCMNTTESVHVGDIEPHGTIDVTSENRMTKFDLTETSETKLKDEENCTITKNLQQPSISENCDDNLECESSDKRTEIYKCKCGLHFLDRESMSSHKQSCSLKIRISKQNCFKCGLLFTQNHLFNHLIKHHGKINETFHFKIVY